MMTGTKLNILFLSRWFPYPTDNGSKLRVMGLLGGLAKQHNVTLLSFADQPDVDTEVPEIRAFCSEVDVVTWQEYDPNSVRAKIGFLRLQPRFLTDTYSSEMDGLIRRHLSKNKFDLIIASQLSMASYQSCFGGTPAIFEELELGQFHDPITSETGFGNRFRLGLTWFKFKNYLFRLIGHFQSCTVASERERDLFVESFPAYRQKIKVIPNCIHVESYQDIRPEPKPHHLIFSGSFKYRANYDAMQWFIGKVYPKILQRMPDTHLIITGDHENLPLPPAKNVIRTGYVEDVRSLVASCTVSLAPLWIGGGTRLKILEAMALGVPVVATSKGSEGLNAKQGEHLLIADSPEAFAENVLELLRDADRRVALAGKARRFAEDHFSWGANLPRFLQLVEDAAQRRYNPRDV